MKRKQIELQEKKIKSSEIKNLVGWLNGELHTAEERTDGLEDQEGHHTT